MQKSFHHCGKLSKTNTINQTFLDVETDDIDISFNPTKIACKDFLVLQTICVLEQSQWLTSSNSCKEIMTIHSKTHYIPTPSTQQLKEWMNSVKEQEIIIEGSRQTGDVLEHFPPNTGINNTEHGKDIIICMPPNSNWHQHVEYC